MIKYDIVIIGGGIGGLMTAYSALCLNKNKHKPSIAIIDKGNALDKRHCPASKNAECKHCKTCSITNGLAGAGAFSDGKFSIGTSYGGTLAEELGEELALKYIHDVDNILRKCFDGDYPESYAINDNLKRKCLQNNLQLLDMHIRHLGTDRNLIIMQNLINKLRDAGVVFYTNQQVSKIEVKENEFHVLSNMQIFEARHIVLAVGRTGSRFVKSVCDDLNIKTTSNAVDIGVRVEMPDSIWTEFSQSIYEPKIVYKTKTFEDKCRTFCFNQGGLVSAENNGGIITANGHSFSDHNKKTKNCNFAILSSLHFTEPFNEPTEYAQNICELANKIGNGNILVQRFGDLIRGRRTTEHRLNQNTVIPTLKATPGDLSLVLPHRILTNIIETIYALDNVAPGCKNDDTLLYGVEAKYFSLKPHHNDKFEIYPNLYCIGDGSGISRGLSQAGAMGLFVGDNLISCFN